MYRGSNYLNLIAVELEKRKAYLEKLQSIIEKQLKSMPTGRLRISNNRGIPRYYHVAESKPKQGKYITKENENLAYKPAQKDYLDKLYIEVEEELQDIKHYLYKHTVSNLEDIYSNMPKYGNLVRGSLG